MKKLPAYFMVGIIPVATLSVSTLIWKQGIGINSTPTPFIFLAGILTVIASWAIAAHHIHWGYLILESISRVMKNKRCRVRLLKITIPSSGKGFEDVILFYLEKKRNYLFYERWTPVKNHEVFPDLENSRSIAYFLDKESALKKLSLINKKDWVQNRQFDPVLIESEYVS
jgi:hypothetical protein